LGPMIAIADEKALYLLEFDNYKGLEHHIEKLQKKTKSPIAPGKTKPIDSIREELQLYFENKLGHFQTPIQMIGSAFQIQVWQELQRIPIGKTCSYSDIAHAIHNRSAKPI
ncbi:MAG TPA: methylated-DNA--[protein]-cysteine S-methyltransferase, partial [Chlamydiales bacterium]|nr:methylated-DNA--[protein]-cysteine S-methyltransferase [Chlamydiales bacterium]